MCHVSRCTSFSKPRRGSYSSLFYFQFSRVPPSQHLLRCRRRRSRARNEILIKFGPETQHRDDSSRRASRFIESLAVYEVHFRANVCHGFPTRCAGEWRHRRGHRPITTGERISLTRAICVESDNRSSGARSSLEEKRKTLASRLSRRLNRRLLSECSHNCSGCTIFCDRD